MALSYFSNWEPFQELDAFCEMELQSLLHEYLFDPNDDDLFISQNNPNSSFLSNGGGGGGLLSYHHHNDTQDFHSHKRQKPFFPQNDMPEFPTTPAVSLSAPSIAARQRRRRITDKTHELGKLVPGGHKMNTAEMLRSAYKYIMFLQAQVTLLGLIQENAVECSEDFQLLVESSLIQEKLYSTENCLVPQNFVQQLHSDSAVSHLIPSAKKEQ